MTTSPPEAPQQGPSAQGPRVSGPRVSRSEVTDLGRLRRTRRDSKIAGVAGGLARHLDIDPVILRVAFVVLAFFGGSGIIIYAAVWLLVPRDGSDTGKIRLDTRSRSVALVLVGVIAVLALLGDSLGGWGFPWPLLIIGVIAFLVVSARRTPEAAPAPVTPSGSDDPLDPQNGHVTASRMTGYQPPPPDPRRRGPKLFWFTMALIALAVGVLGTVDLAGVDVTASAYPALALAITGIVLLIGAFYGRGGGLILVGILLAIAVAVTSGVERIDVTDVRQAPSNAADLAGSYTYNVGDVEIDLSEISDPEALDGRTLEIDLDLGELTVIVPESVDTEASVTLDGFGSINIFGDRRDQSGGDTETGTYLAPREPGAGSTEPADVPMLTIDVRAGVGEISIITERQEP